MLVLRKEKEEMDSPNVPDTHEQNINQTKGVKRRRLGRSSGGHNSSWKPPFASPPSAGSSGGVNSDVTVKDGSCIEPTTSTHLPVSNHSNDKSESVDRHDGTGSPSSTGSASKSELPQTSIKSNSNCTPRLTRPFKSRLGESLSARKRFRGDFKSPLRNQATKPEQATLEDVGRENERLRERLAALDEEIGGLQDEGCSEEELQVHIQKMHEYNELKDMAQMLLGRIAALEGVTTRQLHEELGLGGED